MSNTWRIPGRAWASEPFSLAQRIGSIGLACELTPALAIEAPPRRPESKSIQSGRVCSITGLNRSGCGSGRGAAGCSATLRNSIECTGRTWTRNSRTFLRAAFREGVGPDPRVAAGRAGGHAVRLFDAVGVHRHNSGFPVSQIGAQHHGDLGAVFGFWPTHAPSGASRDPPATTGTWIGGCLRLPCAPSATEPAHSPPGPWRVGFWGARRSVPGRRSEGARRWRTPGRLSPCRPVDRPRKLPRRRRRANRGPR